jgi:hypothetical protein
MSKNIVIRLNREQTYRHLFALCQNDGLFTINDYPDGWQDKDYERIVISDTEAIKNGVKRAVIGTVRLLPYDNGTTMMFVNKDAIWHKEISASDEKLFSQYIERAIEHFTELDLVITKTAENRKSPKDIKSDHDQIWKILISVILLGFALAGFVWLPWTSAVLWLIFLIVAYPVALVYTTAKQSMDNRNLVEIYKAGLKQVPVIGKLFGNKPPS